LLTHGAAFCFHDASPPPESVIGDAPDSVIGDAPDSVIGDAPDSAILDGESEGPSLTGTSAASGNVCAFDDFA
jgi:hypothetical protein